MAIEQAQTVVVSSQSVPTGIQRIDAQPAGSEQPQRHWMEM